MSKNRFDKIVDRYLKGNLEDAEKQKVDDWLNQTAENEAFDNLYKSEHDVVKNQIYQRLTIQIDQAENPVVTKFMWLKTASKIAASIVLAGLIIVLFQEKLKEIFNIAQNRSVVNTKGHITKSILADGSIVWLKGDSKLSFPVKFKGNLRVVQLQGEALFEVAKDAKHPFIIHSGALVTRVLGTSFNIKPVKNSIEVTVLTGHVFLSSKNVVPVDLLPHQKASFSEHQKTLVKEAQPKLQVLELTQGTEYDMLFNDVSLQQVIRRMEEKFEIKIRLENTAFGKHLVTADLTDQSLINSMDMICGALNLSYQIDDQMVIITKKQKIN